MMLQFLFFLIRDVLFLLGYVSGGGSFPKLLSKAEEAEALAAMAAGDEKARARLIKAVNTYKPNAPTPLSTYAARCIENEVLMLLRSSKKRKNEVSLNDPIGVDGEGNDICCQDILGTPPEQVEEDAIRSVSMQQVRALLKTLPPRERMVLEMRYGLLGEKPLMQHEAAARLGLSRSYISRIETRAIGRLRDALMKKRKEKYHVLWTGGQFGQIL